MIRFRLNARLKIAHRKKNDIYSELGKQAWMGGLKVTGAEKIDRTLHKLEEKRTQLQEDLEITLEKFSGLKKNLDNKSLKNSIKIKGKKAELKIETEKLSEVRNQLKEIKSSLAQRKNTASRMDKELSALEKDIDELEKNPLYDEEEIKQKITQSKAKKEDIEKQLQKTQQDIKELKQTNIEKESEEKSLKQLIHNENLETTLNGMHVAGDVSGIEEANTAMMEGRIAGANVAMALGKDGAKAKKIREEALRHLKALRASPFSEKVLKGKEKVWKVWREII